MSNDSAPLGWCQLVAPTSQALSTQETDNSSATQNRIIYQLPGPKNATYQMAPHYLDCVRYVLRRKQVSPEDITLHLKKIRKVPVYGRAFITLCAFVKERGQDLPTISLD